MIGKGFSLVEVIIASAVLILLIGAFGSGIVYTQTRAAMSGDRIRAVLLAEEGMEAVRNIRDDDFSLLTDGQHGLTAVTSATAGPLNCATAVNTDPGGGSYMAWSNLLAGCTSNNTYATALLKTPTLVTHYLQTTNFGFTVPYGVTIAGIEARIERKSVAPDCASDYSVRVVKNGVLGSAEKAAVGWWPTTDTVAVYGNANDQWADTWTAADINGAGFGVAVSAQMDSQCIGTVSIDSVMVTVYYTVPSTQWDFAGTSDTAGIYTRTISIATPDPHTKHVTTTVTWMQNSFIPGTVELVGEFTNWQAPGAGNWASPLEESFYDLAGSGAVYKLAVQGTLAYLTRLAGNPRFAIVDIANSASPQLVGSLPGNPPYGSLRGIHLRGSYAYITSSDLARELQIINISNPNAPLFVASVNLPGANLANGVVSSGNYLYVTRNAGASGNEFFVYDISNPTSPALVGSMNYATALNDMVVMGSYVFIATVNTSQELIVVSVANPSSPTIASSLNLPSSGAAYSLAAYSTTLLMGRASSIQFVNIANPLAPVAQGSVGVGSGIAYGLSLGVTNNYLFAATSDATAEFKVVLACNPISPSLIGTLNTPSALYSTAYHEQLDRAIVGTADPNKELLIIKPQ